MSPESSRDVLNSFDGRDHVRCSTPLICPTSSLGLLPRPAICWLTSLCHLLRLFSEIYLTTGASRMSFAGRWGLTTARRTCWLAQIVLLLWLDLGAAGHVPHFLKHSAQ